MAEQIISKTGDFEGYPDLCDATERQSQYSSRYIEPCWHKIRPDVYPYLGEGLTLKYAKFRVDEQDFILIDYVDGNESMRGNFHAFHLSNADAQTFKQRLDAL
ncbi:MAG: hypothetical protein ACI9TY_000940 [Alphaproteobacteria bacterium]|jgi:hypothetical protein